VLAIEPDKVKTEAAKDFNNVDRGEAERKSGGDSTVTDALLDPVGAWHGGALAENDEWQSVVTFTIWLGPF
jgi:hypothetical protein